MYRSPTGAADKPKGNIMKVQGTTATGVAPATEVVAAAPTRQLGEADYRKLDRSLISSIKTIQTSLDKAGAHILAAHETELWLHVTHSETGKPFKTFTAYLQDRTTEFPTVGKLLTKQLVENLLRSGLSQRAAQAAAGATEDGNGKVVPNVSLGTVNAIAKQIENEGKTVDAPVVDADAEAVKAGKLAKSLPGLLTRVQDAAVDMSDDQLAATLLALNEAVGVLQGIAQHRADTLSGANAQRAARAKTAARKARDAEVAAIAAASKPVTLAENVGLATPRPSVKPSDVARVASTA